jgi:hypothetical protein
VPPSNTVLPQPQRPTLLRSETSEWSSPAFVKRARISYGSLFESRYDIFASDDGTIEGKGRKRSRFSRQSSNWRYSSRSPSPEAENNDIEVANDRLVGISVGSKPLMADEGCQTQEIEEGDSTEDLARLPWLAAAKNTNTSLERDSESFTAQGMIQKVIETSGNSANFPPPSSYFHTDAGFQAKAIIKNQDIHVNLNPPVSPRLHPVSSDVLPLISPLVSRELDTSHGQPSENRSVHGNDLNWHEDHELRIGQRIPHFEGNMDGDMFSLDSSAQSQSHHATKFIPDFSMDLEEPQKSTKVIQLDPTDQYGHWQDAVATHDR